MEYPAVHEPGAAGKLRAVGAVAILFDKGFDFLAEFFREFFVGVEGENPRLRGEIEGEVFLVPATGPRAFVNFGAMGESDFFGGIGAIIDHHHDLGGPAGERFEASGEIVRFVVGDHRDRKRKGS